MGAEAAAFGYLRRSECSFPAVVGHFSTRPSPCGQQASASTRTNEVARMALERFLHGLWSFSALDAFASAAAQYGLYACIAAAAAAWLRRRPRNMVIPLLAGAAGAALLDVVAGAMQYDSRPFVVMAIAPLVPHGIDNGFPSDHSAAAAYAATFALFIDPALGALAWGATVVLGAARLFCLLHQPQDVVAGWIIGAVPAIAAGFYWRNRWITVSSPPPSK